MSLSQAQARSDIVEMLSDPQRLAERLTQLESAEKQANEVLALVGPANQILAIRKHVDQELLDAQEASEKLKAEAASVVALAQQQAVDIEAEARREAASIVAQAAARDADAIERQSQAQGNLAETEREQGRLRTWDAALIEKETGLNEFDASLTKTQDSLLQEKAQLADLREHIAKFVG